MGKFFQELKRRKVLRVAVIYLAAAWVLIQVVDVIAPALQLPSWALLAVISVLALGFPVAIVISWVFDITPSGLRRDDEPTNQAVVGTSITHPFARRQSLAVLPITNLSTDEQQEYFADGLTQDIITDLSQIPELLVMSRNASFGYKGESIDPLQVGRDLNVNLLFQGSVRKSGDHIRVTAQLTDVATGDNFWSRRYDRELQDVFTVQDELTREIVTELEVKLVSGGQGEHRRSKYSSSEAGHLLYKGLYYFYKHDKESNNIARELFRQFKEMEPESVLGYVWTAYTLFFGTSVGWYDPKESMPKVGEFVAKSLAIDSKDPQSLITNAYLQAMSGNLNKATESAEMAVQAGPSMEDAYRVLGWIQMLDGQPKEAIENFKCAERVCPVSGALHLGMLGTAYRNAEQFEKAVEAFEDCIDRYPDFYSARVGLVSTLSLMGDMVRAKEERKLLQRDKPGYSVDQYTAQNFYRDKTSMAKWGESLRVAGLPEHAEN